MITTNEVRLLTWKELSRATYNLDCPFDLKLAEDKILHIENIIRFVPRKRFVALAKWNNLSVVAKLFIDPQNAKRHLRKEVHGLKALAINKIPCARIEHVGMSDDKKIRVLILEKIQHATNFYDVWQNKGDIEDIMPQLQKIVLELATQHVLGIVQTDLHLKNFLITENQLYTLDGASILVTEPLLPKKQSIQNLAVFLSQLGVGLENYQKELFLYYAKSRGWLVKTADIQFLFESIKITNQQRWQEYREKIFRTCTEFESIKASNKISVINRKFLSKNMLAFIENPEAIFKLNYAVLKAGNSATVIKTKIDDNEFVIKRYNLKNIRHWLRRALRPSRAATCWMLAHKLQLFGLGTAKPIAFIEMRKFGLRNASYYISEYIDGIDAAEKLQLTKVNQVWSMPIIERVSNLIKNLLHLNITHGDLKISNILINQHEAPILIDLDGAREHRSMLRLQRKWNKDVNRFLQNFNAQPRLAAEFSANLRKGQVK